MVQPKSDLRSRQAIGQVEFRGVHMIAHRHRHRAMERLREGHSPVGRSNQPVVGPLHLSSLHGFVDGINDVADKRIAIPDSLAADHTRIQGQCIADQDVLSSIGNEYTA